MCEFSGGQLRVQNLRIEQSRFGRDGSSSSVVGSDGGLELVGPCDGLPKTVPGPLTHRFDNENDAAQACEMLTEGRRLLQQEETRWEPVVPRGVRHKIVGKRPEGARPLPLVLPGAEEVLDDAGATPRGVWMMAEPAPGHDIGEDVGALADRSPCIKDTLWWCWMA